jgi:prophage regulatory protein
MTRPKDKPANRRRRFVRYPQLKPEFGIPWSRMHIDRLVAAGKFPRKIHLSANTIGFWSDELEDFLAARDAERGETAA